MGDDIIATVAWECDGVWHKASYWSRADGHSVDFYTDGDHEDIEPAELPSGKEEAESWLDYSRFVVGSGLDPLGAFAVKHAVTVIEKWRFKFNNSIIGPVLVAAKRGRELVAAAQLPVHVRDYLTLDGRGLRKLAGFATWDELISAQPLIQPLRWFDAEIEHERPRAAAAIKRETIALARRVVRNV